MASKLDILAQKEEELRKINEQLDLKNDKIMSGALEQLRKENGEGTAKKEEDDAVEDSMAHGDEDEFKGKLMKPLEDDDDDDYDQYDNDGFEESKHGGSVAQ